MQTGWSEEAILAMPDATFAAYLDLALRSRGIDVKSRIEGDAPPADGLSPDVEAAFREAARRARGE